MKHGTAQMIREGCRCNHCTLVREMYYRSRPRSVAARIVRDHLQALMDDGWTLSELAAHIGYPRQTLAGIVSGRNLWTSKFIAQDILSVPIEVVA